MGAARHTNVDCYEAVIGSPDSTAESITGIEGAAVIQRGRPQVALPTRGRMAAARRAELTLSTRIGPQLDVQTVARMKSGGLPSPTPVLENRPALN